MARNYVPDPATKNTPLQVDEVKALLNEGVGLLKNARVAEHVLHRMLVTIEGNRRDFAQLHRQVATMNAERQRLGEPTTLDPASAARFLPPAEINKLASADLRRKLEQVEHALAEISTAQRTATGRVNAIKFAVATLLEDTTIDDATKQRLLSLVRSLPDPTPEEMPRVDLPRVADVDTGPGGPPAPAPAPAPMHHPDAAAQAPQAPTMPAGGPQQQPPTPPSPPPSPTPPSVPRPSTADVGLDDLFG